MSVTIVQAENGYSIYYAGQTWIAVTIGEAMKVVKEIDKKRKNDLKKAA